MAESIQSSGTPSEVPSPEHNPEIIRPLDTPPTVWPLQTPEITREDEPLTKPPTEPLTKPAPSPPEGKVQVSLSRK